MNQIFISIFNNAIITSFLILAIILIRLIFKRVPKWINCLLWGLVAIKLVMPFSIESALSLIPSAKPVPANIEYVASPKLETGVQVVNQVINPVIEADFTPDPVASVNPMQIVISVLSVVWIVGFVALFLYSLISFLLLRRKVSVSVNSTENVYICDEVGSPFILGIIKPRIYLPTGLSEDTMECVLQHEMAHLKRKDHVWKPLGFLILSVYWFNPLCWVAYVLLCKDIELACDERVTKDKNTEWKKLYCQSLLDCSVRRRTITACPVAFGEVGVKDRVKSVINYKKPTFWIILVAIAAIVVVVVCFMTNPRSEEVINDDGIINDDGNANDIENDIIVTNDEALINGELIEKDEKLLEAANNWAQAFVKKDGQTIVKMSTQEVIEGFERKDYLERHGDMVILGNPEINLEWDNIDSYMIVDQDDENHTVDILYYAYTSDLLVTVWKERVTFTPRLTEYVVSDETVVILDNISTSEEFLSAYPLPRGIYRTPVDYSFSGHGEALNEKALLSSSSLYKDLFEPEGALRHLLNLTEDEKKVRIEIIKSIDTNVVELKVTFLKDNYFVFFNMMQLWGESGIWIPRDYDISHVDFAAAGTNDLTLSELNEICNSPSFVSDIEKEGVAYFAKYSNFVEDKAYPKETAGNGLCLAELLNGDKTYNLFILFYAEEYAKDNNHAANSVDLVYLSNGEKDIYLYIADKEKRDHVDTDITSFIGGVYE